MPGSFAIMCYVICGTGSLTPLGRAKLGSRPENPPLTSLVSIHVDAWDYSQRWKLGFQLLSGRVVALASPHLEIFFQGSNFNGAVTAVRIEVGGTIGNHVLTAQLVFDCGEGILDVFHLEGK